MKVMTQELCCAIERGSKLRCNRHRNFSLAGNHLCYLRGAHDVTVVWRWRAVVAATGRRAKMLEGPGGRTSTREMLAGEHEARGSVAAACYAAIARSPRGGYIAARARHAITNSPLLHECRCRIRQCVLLPPKNKKSMAPPLVSGSTRRQFLPKYNKQRFLIGDGWDSGLHPRL